MRPSWRNVGLAIVRVRGYVSWCNVLYSVRVRGYVMVGFGLGLELVFMLGFAFGFGVGFGHVLGAVAHSGRRTEEALPFAWGYTPKKPASPGRKIFVLDG